MSDSTKATVHEAAPTTSYAEFYERHFVANGDAVKVEAAPSAMPFKIFSLTNNNVRVTYSNGTKI